MNPQQYVTSVLRKLYPTYYAAAQDVCVETNSISRYFSRKAKPLPVVVRNVQLIEFIRSQGLEVPPPIEFESPIDFK